MTLKEIRDTAKFMKSIEVVYDILWDLHKDDMMSKSNEEETLLLDLLNRIDNDDIMIEYRGKE